jgi:outer membrane scaffolding protein for murein synthesis (MipA/OmpV family)
MVGQHASLARAGALLVVGVLGATGARADDREAWDTLGSGWRVGAMAIVAPRYEGSNDYRVMGAPFIMPSFGGTGLGRVDVQGPDDIRFRLFEHQGLEIGPLVGWRFGRDEDDGRRLEGLGDVDGGLVAGGYMAYRLGLLKPFLSYHHQVTGDGGAVLRLGTEATTSFGRGTEVTATVGASWADDDYMKAYFSVTPGQAATSVAGLGVFDAEAGFKDVYAGLTVTVPIDEAWRLRLGARYALLVGDAADSPVVESEHQLSGSLAISYRFGGR